MVKKQQEKYGWEFIFIGANIDAYEEARKFGIRKERAVNYVWDEVGTANVYAGISRAVCSVMKTHGSAKACNSLDESDWSEEINVDFKKRGKVQGRR